MSHVLVGVAGLEPATSWLRTRRYQPAELHAIASGRRGSNSLPPPRQGGAQPHELLPQFYITDSNFDFNSQNPRSEGVDS
jgi:hypothetical protein